MDDELEARGPGEGALLTTKEEESEDLNRVEALNTKEEPCSEMRNDCNSFTPSTLLSCSCSRHLGCSINRIDILVRG